MRVLVCGSRGWTDYGRIKRRLAELPAGSVVVEGCARGADALAELAAESLGLKVEHHPADWSTGRSAGFRRNLEMLDYPIPDLVIAFWDGRSRGTTHTVRIAQNRDIPIEVWNSRTQTIKRRLSRLDLIPRP